jgi:hypothetical protein
MTKLPKLPKLPKIIAAKTISADVAQREVTVGGLVFFDDNYFWFGNQNFVSAEIFCGTCQLGILAAKIQLPKIPAGKTDLNEMHCIVYRAGSCRADGAEAPMIDEI